MQLITPTTLTDYELIDTGNFEKLERFGAYTVSRPEPQAVWQKALPETEWERMAHAVFKRDKNSQEKGQWMQQPDMPDQWPFRYQSEHFDLRAKLALSAFKHVGIFPEQAANWEYIGEKLSAGQPASVLNLFAYTGMASLAARAKGATVTHVDSIKQVISWSRVNMEWSGLDNIRWVVEDAMKFVQREVRRGNTYNGLILDPPAYGRGPSGEKWQLEDQIDSMLAHCTRLLAEKDYFFLINLYSMGFSALILQNLIDHHFPDVKGKEVGELYLQDRAGRKLPLGVFARFSDH